MVVGGEKQWQILKLSDWAKNSKTIEGEKWGKIEMKTKDETKNKKKDDRDIKSKS